jgi:MFS family permease
MTYFSLISIFISCFILMMGNGLINVLLPVKMGIEGLSTDTIGLVLSLYYVGMLLGAIYSKYLISRAGHVRVFAGFVALGAVSVLLSSFDTDPILWGAMRIGIGFCNACAFTAMESWLSDSANKESRGKVLAAYNAVVLGGLFGGQFLLNLAAPSENTLFIIAAILFCLAIIPIALSKNSGPVVEEISSMSIFSLYKKSPLGVVCCISGGLIFAALFNMLPMFAKYHQIQGFELTLYMAVAIFGAFVLQFPVGYLSDKFDRRTIIFLLLLVSAGVGIVANFMAPLAYQWPLFAATSVTTGIIACLYPLSISEAFDKLRQNEMVSAMGSMILAFSIGGIIGPYSAALVMKYFGGSSLFYFLAIIQLLLAGFVFYRMQVAEALPIEKQENFVMQSSTVAAMVDLDPRTQYVPVVQQLSDEARTAVEIAQTDQGAAVKMVRAIAINHPERAVEMASALASVEGIDVLRFYEVMREALPYRIMEIATAMVATAPQLAYELIQKLAKTHPDQVVSVAAEIGHQFPELRVAMAKIAVESAPENAVQVAEYYAQVVAVEREALRPADEAADTSEQDILDITAQLWESAPDQALDVAVTVAEAVPETAVSLAGDLAENIMSDNSDIGGEISLDEKAGVTGQNTDDAALVVVQRLVGAVPESAVDVAVAVVEVIPESAAMVASEVASNIVDEESEQAMSKSAQVQQDILDNDAAVDLVQRLSEASPDNALDVAVAVVEEVPESAAMVASEVASNIVDEEPEQAMSSAAQAKQDILDNDAAVDLVQRLTEASPDNALDVAVAVVEEVPESAAMVASEVASNIVDEEPEQAMSTAAQAKQDILDNDAAVDLVQRLTEASPDNALDVAVAVVEEVPESAAMVASQVASSIGDEETTQSEAQAESQLDEVHQNAMQTDAAIDLLHKLTQAAPDNALDVAVAVVEAVPDSAGVIAGEVINNLTEDVSKETHTDRVERAHQRAINTETAFDLVQRFSEAAPDKVIDVAAAVVDTIPESASLFVDSISKGEESKEGEWVSSLDEAPRDINEMNEH